MKPAGIIFLFLILIFPIIKSQSLRYFEFTTSCGYGNWQDTSFLAATSDQNVIEPVLADIARPLNQRKFISGNIDYGDGGYNHNASHNFLWHYIPNQWILTEMAAEVCDGCPYSDIDADTAYWIGNLGYFCPWSGKPIREVMHTGVDKTNIEDAIILFPNPAHDKVTITGYNSKSISLSINNIIGQNLNNHNRYGQNATIDLFDIPAGFYIMQIKIEDRIIAKKFIIEKK